MLTLLMKDFRLMFPKEGNLARRILKRIFSVLFVVIFVAIETFLFSAILGKIENFQNAPVTFTMLFLMVISILMIASGVLKAKKLFFNELDLQQLASHPVENSKQILSKLIFLFLTHYFSTLLFTYPIFVAYGMMYQKTMWFYYFVIFYPALSSLVELGIMLLLVYPVWMIGEYLRKHVIVEFFFAVVLLFALVYPYSQILNVFVGLVANNELTLLFTEESMQTIANIERFFVPLNFLIEAFLLNRTQNFFLYFSFAGSLFIVGLSITIFTFHHVRNLAVTEKARGKKQFPKPMSQMRALISKELILLSKHSEYIFSYTGLLIVQPFLMYFVLKAMNTIFQSGSFLYYTTLIPGFVPIMDTFLVMMISIVINSGANNYLSIEARTVKNLKTMPISYRTQLLVKAIIPFILSTTSLSIAVLVLYIGGVLSGTTAFFAFVLTLLFILAYDVISMIEELRIRHGKPRSTYASGLFSYVFSFLYVAISILIMYLGTPLWVVYVMGIVLVVCLTLPFIWILIKRMGDWFMDLEAIN